MDIADLAVAVIGTVAGIAGAYFAWVSARKELSRRHASRTPISPVSSPGSGGTRTTTYDVFVSYSHDDAAIVTDLAGRLERRGIRVVYDKLVVGPGSIIFHEVEEAIRNSAHGLLVFSPASMASGPVMNEYYVLLQRSMHDGQLLIPVLVEDVKTRDLPEFVKIRFYSDLRGVSDAVFDRRVDEIAKAVRRAS
ncbi:toll/interleukin-1 receptor domain-containing protein [Streptosporangium sp. NPDC023825]|uniref:toll/interleukin-1 receptor domain-containing protein n=1 Tax=Streptosporangium sp. NPDC023825 TaxID=3154909 RepID=UPI00342F4AC1